MPPRRAFLSLCSLQLVLVLLLHATLSTLSMGQSSSPDIDWPTPEPIVYGTPLSSAQLQASYAGDVAGRFDYSPDIGTVLPAGFHTLSVTFTPDDAVEGSASASVILEVTKAPLTIRADDKTAFFIGDSGEAELVEFVTVGNPGNPAQLIDDKSIGAVSTVFDIGKYEITNEQYTAFLNAVGKNDPITAGQFGPHPPLFNILMETEARGGIVRHGEAPNFTYETKPNMGNKPVNFVSFVDACRFCNWLHNGMPEGAQDASTTEDGAYDLTDVAAMIRNTTMRKQGARYFIPTESEWHKAAFYNPNKGAYWGYPTQSDSEPDAARADSQGNIVNATENVANYGRNADWDSNGNGLIENAPVGTHIGPEDGNVTSVGSGGAGNESYYGTADIGGNVSEWTESALSNWARMTRGGNWNGPSQFLTTSYRFPARFPFEVQDIGFRIARPANGQTQLPLLTVSYFGFVNGDEPVDLGSPVTLSSQATPASPIGTYAIIPSAATSSNYEITYEEGTLLLNEKQNAVIDWPTPADIVYGTPLSNKQLNASASLGGSKVRGSLTYEPPLGTVLDAGSHELSVRFQPDDGEVYNPLTHKVTLQVLPAPLVIRADDKNRQPGSINPSFTTAYQGFTHDDTIDSLWIPVRFTTEANPESPPGRYPIVPHDAFSPNYAITFQAGTLVVLGEGKILPEFDWNPVSLVYGTELGSGQLNAQEINGVPGSFSYDPPLGTVLNAGSGIRLWATFQPDDLSVYETFSVSTTIDVSKAPLTIRVNNLSRVLGIPNPTLTASFDGFMGSDSQADLDSTLTLSTPAVVDSPSGDYPITGSMGPDNNYVFTVVDATLTIIEKFAPEVDWAPPAQITYGEVLSGAQLNAAVADGISGNFSYDPPLGTRLPAGDHLLMVTFTPDNEVAYEDSTASVELTVVPANLTIRAVDVERPEQTENPTLNVAYEGFINGESEADLDTLPTVVTDAEIDSPPGAYAIRVENATALNYTITFEEGTLIITENLELPLLSAKREGDNLLLSWRESATLELQVSRDMIVWETVESAVQSTADGLSRATYSLSQLLSANEVKLYFRLQKTE